jgi:hypothetical protein
LRGAARRGPAERAAYLASLADADGEPAGRMKLAPPPPRDGTMGLIAQLGRADEAVSAAGRAMADADSQLEHVREVVCIGGAAVVLLALAATAAKVAGGLLALALVRPWGRVLPRRWLLIGSAAASVLLIVYGGLNVAAGALVLSGVIHPSGSVDRTALRWHAGVWDLWFLVWGILLALATVSYLRRTANRTAG